MSTPTARSMGALMPSSVPTFTWMMCWLKAWRSSGFMPWAREIAIQGSDSAMSAAVTLAVEPGVRVTFSTSPERS